MAGNKENPARPNKDFAKWSVKRLAIGGAWLLGAVYLSWLTWGFFYDQRFVDIMYQHLAAAIGIPGSIIVAFVIVSILENVAGPIRFEGLGVKFEGASGPIVMWVGVFPALIAGIHLLW